MSGGSPTQWRSRISSSINSLTLQTNPSFTIPASHNSPDGQTDSARARSGVSVGGNSGHQPGITNVARFGAGPIHQGNAPNDVPVTSEHFDDAPYVPSRATAAAHTVPPIYPVQDPRINNAYSSRNPEMQQYPYEGGTSPSESHHSVDSNWSTSSSSSASSQRVPNEYYLEASSHYSQSSLPPNVSRSATYQQHYPAYQGHHHLGLEHVRYVEQPPSTTGGPYYRGPQGYNYDGLLSPEAFDDGTSQVPSIQSPQTDYPTSSQGSSSSSSSFHSSSRHPNVSMFSVSSHSVSENRSLFPDAGPYLRQQLGLPPHEPIGLNSLPDPPPGEKPATPLPMLIKLAIYSSPNKQLTLQEIYTYLENRFEWFRQHRNDKAWKNSIRHNLSLNKVFRHVPRPITEPGKGSYWQLDISEGEGYKRPRKRRAKNRLLASEDDDDDDNSEMEDERGNSEPSQYAGPSRMQSAPVFDDSNIDPELRGEGGHVVGEGRTRAATRRPLASGAGSPYPSHSPRFSQTQLPPIQGPDASALGQPSVRFGQPSFAQPSFASYGPARATTPAIASGPMLGTVSTHGPISTNLSRPQIQRSVTMATYQLTEPVNQPVQVPRQASEYSARRVNTYPLSHQESTHSASDSSSSGSSRTWKAPDTQSRSQR